MSTLADILALLPDNGVARLAYNSDFWVRKANQILGEIETRATGPDLYEESYIPIPSSRQTMFKIPSNLRVVQRVRWPNENGMRDLRLVASRIEFEIQGGFVRLSDPSGVQSTFVDVTHVLSSSWNRLRGDVSLPLPTTVAEGWGCIVTHAATGRKEYRRVLSAQAESPPLVYLDGETVEIIAAGDTAQLFDVFMVLEGRRRLDRFANLESVSPLPEEWNQILSKGLRWALEVQSDEDGASEASQTFYGQFLEALESYCGDISERPGDQGTIQPQSSSVWDAFF